MSKRPKSRQYRLMTEPYDSSQRTVLRTPFVCRDCHETYMCVVGLPVHNGCRVGCEQSAVAGVAIDRGNSKER
jgi:hypothetical protein